MRAIIGLPVWGSTAFGGPALDAGLLGLGGGAYLFHAGYWGPHVGFYGGVNYGFGYGGVGFGGGRWEGGHFAYNTAVMNVNRTFIHNTYEDRTVINRNMAGNRTSFSGGAGGIQARPSRRKLLLAGKTTLPRLQSNRIIWRWRERIAAIWPRQRRSSAECSSASSWRTRRKPAAAHRSGVRSGQMTAGETRNVEGREASINRQTANDRAANGGRLTTQGISRSTSGRTTSASRSPR